MRPELRTQSSYREAIRHRHQQHFRIRGTQRIADRKTIPIRLFDLLRKLLPRKTHPSPYARLPLSTLEKIIGYRFKNPALLCRALSHRSILHETGEDHTHANERFEFLGDAILDLIVVEYLCNRFPKKNEGELSKLKSMVVSGKSLQRIARRLDLGNFILMSDNESRNGGRQRGSILEDTLEAIVAALYLDGGKTAAEEFIRSNILTVVDSIERNRVDHNYKSQLLEYLQARSLTSPSYHVISSQGPDHAKLFQVEVSINGKMMGHGNGTSKKSAEQRAAQAALDSLMS